MYGYFATAYYEMYNWPQSGAAATSAATRTAIARTGTFYHLYFMGACISATI